MIDLNKPNEWQKFDKETGLLFPWLVESFLDELKTWDLKDKKIFEYGLGASSVWWSNKCKEFYGVESNDEWFIEVRNNLKRSNSICIGAMHEKKSYVEYIHFNAPYDIVVVDGEPVEWRDDCIKAALECINPRGKLIVDNWLQPSVWMASEEIQKLLWLYPTRIYKQTNHPDWQTAVFTIS